MTQQVDTNFREVLSQMSQANLVRLFPWFLSAMASSTAGPLCSVSEAFTTSMQPRVDAPMEDITPELKDTTAPASMSSPACWASTLPPPALPGQWHPSWAPILHAHHQFQTQNVGLLPQLCTWMSKWQEGYAGTKEASISSGCSTLPIQLAASHSPTNLSPSSSISPPVKSRLPLTLTMGWPQRPVDHDRDSAVEASGNNAHQGVSESDSDSNSWGSAADSGPKSVSRDCLTCSDTEEVAVISTCKKFQKKVQAFCSITKGCLWTEGQLRWIGDSHHTMYGKVTMMSSRQRWDLTLKEDHSSFEVNKMTGQDWPTALNQWGYPLKNAHLWAWGWGPWEKEDPIVQSLKQFHAHFYWCCIKRAWPMLWLAHRVCIQVQCF